MGTLEIVGASFLFSLVVFLVLVEAYRDWRWKGVALALCAIAAIPCVLAGVMT
jgi:hypothetical protein